MRPERLYLRDMVEAADNIALHIASRPHEQFEGDVTVRAADFRNRHPEVPWTKIVAFRNLVVHEYFGLDWSIVSNTATTLVPGLRRQIAGVLTAEFPEDSGSKP